MLPSVPWYIDVLFAVLAIILAFGGAYVYYNTSSPVLRIIGGLMWLIAVVLGLNAAWNFTSDEDTLTWPFGWVSAGYAIALIFAPLCLERSETK